MDDSEVPTGVRLLYRRNNSGIELNLMPDEKVKPRKRK